MEGITSEAASIAGHHGLGELIYIYDDNEITIDGGTDLSFSEDVLARMQACGWHVQRVDGHDREAIEAAIEAALRKLKVAEATASGSPGAAKTSSD